MKGNLVFDPEPSDLWFNREPVCPHCGGKYSDAWEINFGGDMEGRIKRIVENPPISQDGNSIRVGESNDHQLFNNLSIDYVITAPASVALNLHSGSGDITIDHAGRYLSASSGSGDVRAQRVTVGSWRSPKSRSRSTTSPSFPRSSSST